MSEHVVVTDAEGETKHIGVRQNRAEHRNQKRAGIRPAARLLPSRVATNPCVTIVGIGRSIRSALASTDFSHAQSRHRLQDQPKHLGRYEQENGCATSDWSVGRLGDVEPSSLAYMSAAKCVSFS